MYVPSSIVTAYIAALKAKPWSNSKSRQAEFINDSIRRTRKAFWSYADQHVLSCSLIIAIAVAAKTE